MERKMYLAAIDAGASEIKASIFDLHGREVASASRDCPSETPAPGWAQAPPDVLTGWPLAVLRQAVSELGAAAHDIAAVGVTGSRATILPVDDAGNAVGPIIFWYDRRAGQAAEWLAKRVGARRFFELTGVPLDPTPSVTKIIWLRDSQPDAFVRTATFLLPQSVVLNALTGAGWYCDISYGSYLGLMALAERRWSPELLAAAELTPERLPQLVEPGTVIGGISRAASQATGLRPGTPVVASGSDAACFKLGAGVTGEAVACLYIGTAGAVGVISDRPAVDQRLTCCPAALAGRWDIDALLLTGGSAYRWLRDLLNAADDAAPGLSFAQLDARAEDVAAGSEGITVVPHLAGAGSPLWEPQANGAIVGLRLSHGPGHLARAVLEGIAYAHRHALAALQDVVGPVRSLQMTGGGGASPLWAQIIADVTGLPVSVPISQQSTALGAALIAGVAASVFTDAIQAIAAMSQVERQYEPRAEHQPIYHSGYQTYLQVLELLRRSPAQ